MDDAIVLRRAEDFELEHVHKMQVLSFSETLEKYRDYETNPAAETIERVKKRHNLPNSGYFLIIHAKNPIGAIRVITDEKEEVARISPMFVVPENQNSGYGAMAVRAAMNLFHKAIRWELDTIEEEVRLCRFYERLGFVQTGERENLKEGMNIVNYELSIM